MCLHVGVRVTGFPLSFFFTTFPTRCFTVLFSSRNLAAFALLQGLNFGRVHSLRVALYRVTERSTTAVVAAVNDYFPWFIPRLVFYSARFSLVYIIRQYT